jgi:hypothetical protein
LIIYCHICWFAPASGSNRHLAARALGAAIAKAAMTAVAGTNLRMDNEARTHLSLSKDAPVSRAVQAVGGIVATPRLGGLHHRYVRI